MAGTEPGYFERRRTRKWLRKCESVSEGCRLVGRPTLQTWPGCHIRIGARFYWSSLPEMSHMMIGGGAHLTIGDDVRIGHGASISALRSVTIGDGAVLGPFVTLMDTDFHVAGNHAATPETAPIVIGKGVSIGSGVTILRGSTVEDGARVEANSVVSGHVRADAIVSGVPARPLGTAASGEVESDVAAIVQRTLGLSVLPGSDDGPDTLAGWDSLGTLRLLLALEEAFEVALGANQLSRVRQVRDIAGLVEVARQSER